MTNINVSKFAQTKTVWFVTIELKCERLNSSRTDNETFVADQKLKVKSKIISPAYRKHPPYWRLTWQATSSNLRLTINAFIKTLTMEGDNVLPCLMPLFTANIRERLLFQHTTQIFKPTNYTKLQRQQKTLRHQEDN